MKKIWKRVCTGILALTTILTALPITSVQAAETQYWTESAERVGHIEHLMNDGTIKSTFNEGHMRVEGETAYCVDINTGFKNGYKTRHDASASMSADQIEDVALSLEYMKQYAVSHSNLSANQAYLLEQCLVWQRLSEHLGWQCDNVRVVYSEISQDIQNEVYAGAKSFVKTNKGRYKCGGYIYTGEGQDIGQFWAELNVGNAKVKKTTANEIVTNGNAMYSIAGATFGIFSDQNCSNQIGTLTTNENGDTNEVEVTAGTVYIKELSAPKGYKLDTTVRSLKVEAAFEVVVSRNKVTIDLGTLTDEYEKEITIHTTATDKETGEKIIVAGKKVTIVDTVTLDGLEEGRKYQLKGWQMLKEENAELLIDGKRVESDYTFVADNEKMKVEISYMFDASELGGQNLVTFEELYDLKNPEEPVKVAEHKDIDDEGQTVLITERKILIHTTATDQNGKKEIEAGKDLTIVDTVTLEGLEIGTNYKLSGWQMVKAENAKLLIDGKEVTNDYEFTADKENMEVRIEFTLDGSTLGGKQLVTFEELYDMTNPEEPKKVTEHKDINDEGQTVTIKEVPETPTPETPGTTTKTSNPPKTGDTANAALWIAILVLSAAGITGVRIWNKKKQVKRLGIEEKKEEKE